MTSVGVITYHAAYNYGSVLQAYATQEALLKCGLDVEIIDYRPLAQKKYYEHLYRYNFGIKTFLKDFCMLPVRKARKQRMKRFEDFIQNMLHLSQHQYVSQEELRQLSGAYDIYVSGSDQIWNKHSNELEHDSWSAMNPYLLTFTKHKKISYASSPASMLEDELNLIADKLQSFDFISARESDAAAALAKIIGKPVPNVLDPTLLLYAHEWENLCGNTKSINHTSYMVYYSLDGTNKLAKRIPQLKKLAHTVSMPILLLTPFAYVLPAQEFIDGHAVGPTEFIQVIHDASLVVTDSYHGTLFSINLNVPFWSISKGEGSSTRKDQILVRLGLPDHIIHDLDDLFTKENVVPQRLSTASQTILDQERIKSMQYLDSAIK